MKEILDKFKEFKGTLSERIRSPFVGSFMVTWALLHWRIVAFLLYNEDKITIQNRIDKVDLYLKNENFGDLVGYPILITLGVLFSYSILNALGLIIKLGYDNWASPLIQSILNNPNIIEKSKYEKLKKEYNVVKKDYEDDKDRFINANKEAKEIAQNFDAFRNSAFPGTNLNHITDALRKDVEWENYYRLPDGKTGSEIFTCDMDGFTLKDGSKIKIQNIKITQDGKILTFEKIIDDKPHSNFLIRDSDLNYHGIEDDKTIITYRRNKPHNIIIYSAKYICENNFIDVKEKIQELIDRNIFEFKVSNELMGGDPGFGKAKQIELSYSIDGRMINTTAIEEAVVKLLEVSFQ